MESLCFALSLGYKMRLLEQEKHLLTLENELEKQRLRIQIARDLHDEVGSSVGSITLYIKRLKMISGKSATDVQAVLDQINLIALKTSQALNDAIWSIDARKESYSDLVLRVKEYAQPLAEANDMRCKIEVDLPEGKVSTIFKRNVWLILKESINNAVKHSGSDSLVIKIVIRGSSFMASIMDKGVGFDPKKIRAEGNGLQNIDSRASELGGSVHIQTEKGRGTSVVLTIPVNEK
jgi:signal transduction histidine kinase